MNTVTSILLNLVKMAIAFLLAFYPLQHLAAQDAGQEKQKTLRIKIMKEVDGKTQLTDTTVQLADHAVLLPALEDMGLDSAMLRRLHSGLSATILLDTLGTMGDLKAVSINSTDFKIDTAALRGLHPGKVNVYRLDGNVHAADAALLEGIRNHIMDTTMAHTIKGNIMRLHLSPDSALHARRIERLRNGDVVTLRSAGSPMLLRDSKDSTVVIRLQEERKLLREISPNSIERIIVHKRGSAISLDSLLTSGVEETQLKVVTDEKTGEKKVYRIDKNGKEEEMKAEYLKLDHGNVNVVIFRKARIEDITAKDKEALKEVGAAVETKKKEALDLKKISFYPNPNNGRFNLNFRLEDKGTTRVSVMDSNGEEVFVDTAENLSGQYERQIDLTPFGPGIYYLQIAQGGKYHTKKILVN